MKFQFFKSAMSFLSIVVPVYNKAKYIDNCILSILNQDFEDFELILVNDGSSDDSGNICDRYAQTDPRIKTIHQVNQGVSQARNAGISVAVGEFIGFVDADDTIDERMYEVLVRNAIQNDSEISICRLREDAAIKVYPDTLDSVSVLDPDESLRWFFEGKLDFSACNKIFSRRVAKSVRFEGRMFEDTFYTFQAFLLSNRAVVIPSPLYNYFNSDNSASVSEFGPKYFDVIRVTGAMVQMTKARAIMHVSAAMAMDLVMNLSMVNLILFSGKKKYNAQYDEIIKCLRSYKEFVTKHSALSAKHRAAYYLVMASERIYFAALKIYCLLFPSHVGQRI